MPTNLLLRLTLTFGDDDVIGRRVGALRLFSLPLCASGGLFSLPLPLGLFPLSLHD